MTLTLLTDRRSWLVLLLFLGVALAGCQHAIDDDDGDTPPANTEDDDDDDPEPALPSEPAPAGTAISQNDLQALVAEFDDEPLGGGQNTPKHVFKWVSEDAFIFLHLDNPEPQEATGIHYVGVATKGVFCSQDQPEDVFTHFHKQSADSWEAGHGGAGGEEGFWFVHVAVSEHDEPWGTVKTGADYDFMPTDPPECDEVPEPTFEDEDAGQIAKEELDSLVALFDDQPMHGGQNTPKHVFKWITEDVFIFLHLDNPDPAEATDIHYFGPAIRGQFCTDTQPHTDFTHFHKWEADTWGAGHGGQAGAYGYWFLHNAVTPHEEPWGQVDYGPDRNFMPTDASSC